MKKFVQCPARQHLRTIFIAATALNLLLLTFGLLAAGIYFLGCSS
jgi:hypothetical protein